MSGHHAHHAATSFVVMWTVMMVAMMLPSLAPTLWHYHRVVDRMGARRAGSQTLLMGVGYFTVWAAVGLTVFALGAVLDVAEVRLPALARAVPFAKGAVVLAAGALQLSAWKAHRLARCRAASAPGCREKGDAATAWRKGVSLGVQCSLSCAGLTATLLAIGVMDLRAMALVTAAITAERLTPHGAAVARATGSVILGVGLLLFARAAGVA